LSSVSLSLPSPNKNSFFRNSVHFWRLLTIVEYLKRDGRTLIEIAYAVLLGDENSPALCEQGCEVEPDGKCCHGCPSILRVAGLI